MKKQKKISIAIILFFVILLSSCQVFATSELSCSGEMQFSEEFLEYMQLEDNKNVIMPRMYNIPKTKMAVTNPLKFTRMLGSASDTQFSLKTIIPENMVVKNQHNTGSCWAFASLAALESTLALKDYNNGLRGSNAIVYDFSERHMEYATSQSFLNDDAVNPNGFNREVGDGGSAYQYSAYLTNGTGAIAESQMPFEKNENDIDISLIQNKTVITQVDDIVEFPSYEVTDDTTLIKQQMKQHITNYGGIEAGIHGATLINDECYNNETGALYCNKSTCSINHSVLIVGWNDEYEKENFLSTNQPANDGAWIIKNSWGDGSETYTLAEMKEYIFECFPDACAQNGWTTAAEIPDDTAIANFTNWGYTIDENNVASQKVGDAGFMYVSYEDVNIYQGLTGIVNAQNELTYENLYQYDKFGGYMSAIGSSSKMYLASVFDRKSSGVEYLTHVAINAPETYTCKVFVNPDGSSTAKADLDPVQLKAGESETFDAGYHTIEFLNPIKINGSSFVVVIEVQGTRVDEDAVNILMEFNTKEFAEINSTYAAYYVPLWDTVTVENDKCFMATEEMFNANQWNDTGDFATLSNGTLPDFDTTIKAFTTSKILESIAVTTPPTNTSYVVGQDFDATGMVVKAFYANGTSEVITDYTIADGTDLALGQTSVTISYEGKTTTQSIQVVENTVESIAITTAPTNTVYWAGDDFDATGMVVVATYKDGTTQTITDYTIQNGTALQNGQTSVTIEYAGKTATQSITVKANSVEKIEITKVPTKTKYVVGQNFNPAGMEVTATYANGTSKAITNYTIQDGTNLQENQTSVTIEFEGKTAIQAITVEVKSVTAISVKTMPTKTEYIQNKEDLDLTGGEIEILYNDGNKETMSMTSEEITVSGFNKQQAGAQTITLTYQGKTTQFDVVVKELPKPENSKFDDMQGNVNRIRAYYFTSDDKKEYTVINVELDNIVKATENDNMEYYYHVSANQQETGITDWIKINELQQTEKGLSFEINTADISNYEEVSNAENLYLYIKEVAIRNDMKSEQVTSSMLLEIENVNVEKFVDGEKVAEVSPDTGSTPGEETDNTLASGTIPNAGKSLFIICLMFVIVVVGRIAYLRYKDIQIK